MTLTMSQQQALNLPFSKGARMTRAFGMCQSPNPPVSSATILCTMLAMTTTYHQLDTVHYLPAAFAIGNNEVEGNILFFYLLFING